eukprot:3658659-Rhodomonas_salina.1
MELSSLSSAGTGLKQLQRQRGRAESSFARSERARAIASACCELGAQRLAAERVVASKYVRHAVRTSWRGGGVEKGGVRRGLGTERCMMVGSNCMLAQWLPALPVRARKGGHLSALARESAIESVCLRVSCPPAPQHTSPRAQDIATMQQLLIHTRVLALSKPLGLARSSGRREEG